MMWTKSLKSCFIEWGNNNPALCDKSEWNKIKRKEKYIYLHWNIWTRKIEFMILLQCSTNDDDTVVKMTKKKCKKSFTLIHTFIITIYSYYTIYFHRLGRNTHIPEWYKLRQEVSFSKQNERNQVLAQQTTLNYVQWSQVCVGECILYWALYS